MAVLFRARQLVSMSAPPLADGAVLVDDTGIVRRIGPYRHLADETATRRDIDGILMPALVNAHVHLELTPLAGRIAPGGPMPTWIERLLSVREAAAVSDEAMLAAGQRLLAALQEQGVGAVLDIGNRPAAAAIDVAGPEGHIQKIFLREVLGPGPEASEAVRRDVAEEGEGVTAHAPYSCSAELLVWVKERCRRRGDLFSIHVAESADEVEYLTSGRGEFVDFFARRGITPPPSPGMRPVSYLDRLGVLDRRTVCVHAVHVEADEIELLARRGARIVLCPGSNRFIGVGRPPVARMLEAGLLPGLGTDSPASNEIVSLWREMRILAEDQPAVAPETIVAMATLGGAAALGIEERCGRIAPGTGTPLLAVRPAAPTLAEVFEYLVHHGETCEVEWLS